MTQPPADVPVEQPIRKPEYDGVYTRCVWCGGENYGPAVIGYSKGEIPCASVNNCGKKLPEDYIRLPKEEKEQ